MKRTPCGESGGWFTLPELLKLQESGQFPDESVKIDGTQIHCVDTVLVIVGIKAISDYSKESKFSLLQRIKRR